MLCESVEICNLTLILKSPLCLHNTGWALNYRKMIDNFVAKTQELHQYKLTSEDWVAISLVSTWLKDFCLATT